MFEFDASKEGFRTLLKDYQEMALRFLWESGDKGRNSREVWLHVNKNLADSSSSISRASIINFLNKIADEKLLHVTYRTGKGGHQGIYSPIYDEEGFKLHAAKEIISKLLEMWPDTTRRAIEDVMGAK